MSPPPFPPPNFGLQQTPPSQSAVRAEVRRLDLLSETDRFTTALMAEVGAPSRAEQARAKALAQRIAKRATRKAG